MNLSWLAEPSSWRLCPSPTHHSAHAHSRGLACLQPASLQQTHAHSSRGEAMRGVWGSPLAVFEAPWIGTWGLIGRPWPQLPPALCSSSAAASVLWSSAAGANIRYVRHASIKPCLLHLLKQAKNVIWYSCPADTDHWCGISAAPNTH